MARLNAWFSPQAIDKAVSGDWSGVESELPAVAKDSGIGGTIIRTTFAPVDFGYGRRYNEPGVSWRGYRFVSAQKGAGYNGGDRIIVEYDPARDTRVDPISGEKSPLYASAQQFAIDQYRRDKSNVTMDIAMGVAAVATAGYGFTTLGGIGAATEISAAEIASASGAGAASTGAGAASTGTAAAGAGINWGAAIPNALGIAKGAVGAVGTIAGALGAVAKMNESAAPKVNGQGTPSQNLTAAQNAGSINSAISPLLIGAALFVAFIALKG